MVRKQLPNTSLGTAYRNLELLAEQGEILKLPCAGGQTRFDGNPEEHCHVRCTRYGRVLDVETNVSVRYNKTVTDDYEITGHRVELFGPCARCKKK